MVHPEKDALRLQALGQRGLGRCCAALQPRRGRGAHADERLQEDGGALVHGSCGVVTCGRHVCRCCAALPASSATAEGWFALGRASGRDAAIAAAAARPLHSAASIFTTLRLAASFMSSNAQCSSSTAMAYLHTFNGTADKLYRKAVVKLGVGAACAAAAAAHLSHATAEFPCSSMAQALSAIGLEGGGRGVKEGQGRGGGPVNDLMRALYRGGGGQHVSERRLQGRRMYSVNSSIAGFAGIHDDAEPVGVRREHGEHADVWVGLQSSGRHGEIGYGAHAVAAGAALFNQKRVGCIR